MVTWIGFFVNDLREDELKLKAVTDENLRRDGAIEQWKLIALKHESEAKTIHIEKKKQEGCLKALNLQLVEENDGDKIISAKLIESQKVIQEKVIQDLNLKLQNQINRSQGLKTREKSLLEEVETLRAECRVLEKRRPAWEFV